MKKTALTFIIIVLASLTAQAQTAQTTSVPPLINYQGMLADANGNPLTGTKKLTFNIYDAAIGGNVIWGQQIFDNVPLFNGRFNVILGTTDTEGRLITDAFSSGNRYLGIKVDSNSEIAPRQQILSTPFAIQAGNGAPIGTILAWHKNFPKTPPLSYGWVECNGQVLDDTNSPYNGQTIPNLNGEARFLRGSSVSGTPQDMGWKSFSVNSGAQQWPNYTHGPTLIPKSGLSPGTFTGAFSNYPSATVTHFTFDASEVRPINMSVVWIMRIK